MFPCFPASLLFLLFPASLPSLLLIFCFFASLLLCFSMFFFFGGGVLKPKLYIYMYNPKKHVVNKPEANPKSTPKSQLGRTYILSLLFHTVNVYCDYLYIYIYIGSSHRVRLLCWCFFARPMHSTAKFATTVLIKIKSVCACVLHHIPLHYICMHSKGCHT